MPDFKWKTNATREQFSLLDEIQHTKNMNTRVSEERKFDNKASEVGWVVLIFM